MIDFSIESSHINRSYINKLLKSITQSCRDKHLSLLIRVKYFLFRSYWISKCDDFDIIPTLNKNRSYKFLLQITVRWNFRTFWLNKTELGFAYNRSLMFFLCRNGKLLKNRKYANENWKKCENFFWIQKDWPNWLKNKTEKFIWNHEKDVFRVNGVRKYDLRGNASIWHSYYGQRRNVWW